MNTDLDLFEFWVFGGFGFYRFCLNEIGCGFD